MNNGYDDGNYAAQSRLVTLGSHVRIAMSRDVTVQVEDNGGQKATSRIASCEIDEELNRRREWRRGERPQSNLVFTLESGERFQVERVTVFRSVRA